MAKQTAERPTGFHLPRIQRPGALSTCSVHKAITAKVPFSDKVWLWETHARSENHACIYPCAIQTKTHSPIMTTGSAPCAESCQPAKRSYLAFSSQRISASKSDCHFMDTSEASTSHRSSRDKLRRGLACKGGI